ncbi:MAG: glyoxalase superfamily protein [Gammaproteobacteria bacterium]|nr:glyoxalase superfamily protein [Gammaproteobacteria bacterium]
MISVLDAKKQAATLKQYLQQNNSAITHSSCLHAVAKMYGYKDWNTMSGLLSEQDNQINTDDSNNPIYSDSAKISNHALISFINEGSTGGFDVVCYKIILFILSELKKNSISIPDKEIIRKSLWNRVSKEDFNRSFELLLISNFILKKQNENGVDEFFLNPHWFWKGDDNSREKFLRKFYASEFNAEENSCQF